MVGVVVAAVKCCWYWYGWCGRGGGGLMFAGTGGVPVPGAHGVVLTFETVPTYVAHPAPPLPGNPGILKSQAVNKPMSRTGYGVHVVLYVGYHPEGDAHMENNGKTDPHGRVLCACVASCG